VRAPRGPASFMATDKRRRRDIQANSEHLQTRFSARSPGGGGGLACPAIRVALTFAKPVLFDYRGAISERTPPFGRTNELHRNLLGARHGA